MADKIPASADQNDNLIRNIRIYPFFRLFFNLLIIGPILVPFMLFKGLSYAEIMLLQSISAISVIVFEVPTGALADKVSRSRSLQYSGFFLGFALALYVLFRSFWIFALAEIMFGIGITLSSGADAAIVYESLVRQGRKKEYQKLEAHAAFYVFLGQAAGSVLSSFLYTYNPFLPFWISIFNIGIACFLASGFTDVEREKSHQTYLLHVLKSVSIARKTPRIFWTVLFSVMMGFALRTTFWLYQPYFSRVGIEIKWFGLIFCYYNLLAAVASKFLVRRFYETRPRRVLLSLALLLSASYLLPAIFIFPWMIAVIGLQQIVRGMYTPTIRFYINHHIRDEYRATVISLVSLSASLGFALLSPLAGITLDTAGAIPTYFWVGAFTAIATLALIILRRWQKLQKIRKAG